MPERIVINDGAGFVGSRSAAAHRSGATTDHHLDGLDPVRRVPRQLARA